MYLILLEGGHQAQQRPANRFKTGPLVVEISAIEYNIASLISDTRCTEDTDLMGFDATGTYLTPLHSWRQAQQSRAIRSRIGAVVMKQSAREVWDHHGIYKDNSYKGQRLREF